MESSCEVGELEAPCPDQTRGIAEGNCYYPCFANEDSKKLRILLKSLCWWLTPIILVTWETETRRIKVRSQPRQIVQETLSQKNQHRKGLTEQLKGYSTCLASMKPWVQTPVPSKKKKKSFSRPQANEWTTGPRSVWLQSPVTIFNELSQSCWVLLAIHISKVNSRSKADLWQNPALQNLIWEPLSPLYSCPLSGSLPPPPLYHFLLLYSQKPSMSKVIKDL
jgi:hypothetical protein